MCSIRLVKDLLKWITKYILNCYFCLFYCRNCNLYCLITKVWSVYLACLNSNFSYDLMQYSNKSLQIKCHWGVWILSGLKFSPLLLPLSFAPSSSFSPAQGFSIFGKNLRGALNTLVEHQTSDLLLLWSNIEKNLLRQLW